MKLLHQSTTLYVGNLSFYTTEEQIYELFSKCGPIRRIIMGLNRDKKTPCGFCFVEYLSMFISSPISKCTFKIYCVSLRYYKRESALDCLKYIDKTKLDSRTIRVDLDYGFCKDRNLGRGKRGGQVRDDHRIREDSGFSSGQRIHPQEGFPYFGKSYGYQDFGYRSEDSDLQYRTLQLSLTFDFVKSYQGKRDRDLKGNMRMIQVTVVRGPMLKR